MLEQEKEGKKLMDVTDLWNGLGPSESRWRAGMHLPGRHLFSNVWIPYHHHCLLLLLSLVAMQSLTRSAFVLFNCYYIVAMTHSLSLRARVALLPPHLCKLYRDTSLSCSCCRHVVEIQ